MKWDLVICPLITCSMFPYRAQNKALKPEEQMISPLPDIKRATIGPEDKFMIIACDGIWNFMTSQEVIDFVRVRIEDGSKKLSEICEEVSAHGFFS